MRRVLRFIRDCLHPPGAQLWVSVCYWIGLLALLIFGTAHQTPNGRFITALAIWTGLMVVVDMIFIIRNRQQEEEDN